MKMGNIYTAYFKNLFTAQESESINSKLKLVEPKVTTSMNTRLSSRFSSEEVFTALH